MSPPGPAQNQPGRQSLPPPPHCAKLNASKPKATPIIMQHPPTPQTDAAPPDKSLSELSQKTDGAILLVKSNIDPECRYEVVRQLAAADRAERLTLLLESPGGSITDAFWIAQTVRSRCRQLDVVVTGWAKSAATLIALSADRIFLGSAGELGPLDVQLHDFSGGARSISPLETMRGMEFLRIYYLETFDNIMSILLGTLDVAHALEQATQLLAPIATPLYQLVDYRELGNAFRLLSVSEAYAQAVLRRWSPLNQKDDADDAIEKIVRQLVWEYPDHRYIIDLEECHRIGLCNAQELPADIDTLCRQVLASTPDTMIAYCSNGNNPMPTGGCCENGCPNNEKK